jgi:hypothetical protein
MARIERTTQKIFAGEADNNGVFGSLQAGAGTTTSSLKEIQSLPAFTQGWNLATVSSEKLPSLEEMQGLQFLFTSQLAYQFQEGMPEWDAETTYYKGSMIKVFDGEDVVIYFSNSDDNIGNQPASDSEYWTTWSTSGTVTYWD